ncbi:MAG: hypothetical protein KTR30_27195 [Saprospiraceae bacterium]|nr:hypothetical protein [Saprospiraceae bacterium]
MRERIVKTVILCFTVLWITSILLAYWHHNPGYRGTIGHFQYYDLWVGLAILAGGSWLLIRHWSKKKQPPFRLNGLGLLAAFIFLNIIIVALYYSKALPGQLSFFGLLNQLGYVLSIGACTLAILWTCYELGAFPMSWFRKNIRAAEQPILQLAIGVMLFTFGLFLLGSLHLLKPTILIPLLVTFWGVNYRKSISSLKRLLLDPIPIQPEINLVGISASLILALLVSLNYIQVLWISPTGYDSMTLYIKLAGLIGDHQGLVAGHQPYYWTLFMATGLTAFTRIEVVMALSMAGGVLTLMAFYHLARRWLDANFSLLVVTLFYSVPLVHFQSALDPKTDLGLLFFLVCLLLLFCNWLDGLSTKGEPTKLALRSLPIWLQKERLLVLIGLVAGFAIGIKMTAILAVFALVIALWYAHGKDLGFVTAVAASLFFMLLLRLDDVQLLRQYHLGAEAFKWILLLVTLLALGLSAKKNLGQFKKVMIQTSLLSLFILVPISPWLIKNFAETRSLSVTALLNGQTANPKLDIDQVEENWRQRYEGQ